MSRIGSAVASIVSGVALFALSATGHATDRVVEAPPAKITEPVSGHSETAVLAGGCFWGVEGVYAHVKGIISTTAGYAGGQASTANYETVSTGTTRHAEAVRIVFDPAKINYADVLRIYFSVVTDPTLVDRQGPDTGPQYRSVLFPLSDAQAKVAKAYIAQLSQAHVYGQPIVTQIDRHASFFPAEAHHQDFMARNPGNPYIVAFDAPKVAALEQMFPLSWKA